MNTIVTFSGIFRGFFYFSTTQKREEELRLSAEANSLGLDPAKSELHSFFFFLCWVCWVCPIESPIERTYTNTRIVKK